MDPTASRVEYIHDISKGGMGGTTIAYEYDSKAGMYRIGVSICSENDKYSRKIGRIVSHGRLQKRPLFIPATIRQYDDFMPIEKTYLVGYLHNATAGGVI